MHDCKRELRDAELKVTPARLSVLRVLEDASLPLDAVTIKNRVKGDKVTIFRILRTLSDKGIIKQIQLNEGKLRYEYASKPKHHHFICERCGKIIDVMGCNIHILEKDIEKKKRVLVKRHSLEFFGLCASCQQ